MEKKGKILIVDDNDDILFTLRLLLRSFVAEVVTTNDPGQIPRLYRAHQPDCVLLDMNFHRDHMDCEEGFYWLDYLRRMDPDAVVVMMTAFGDVENAVRSIKNGALDFVVKPWDNQKLLDIVLPGIKVGAARRQAAAHEQQRQSAALAMAGTSLIGQSDCMKEVCQVVQRVAPTEANILILGENGTGKDVVAHMIWQFSKRSEKPFESVDLASLPENLFESEVFGHEKGAFTDAHMPKAGRLEAASGGTLFLDEIGNLTPVMQSKLLTVLETGRVSRVGSTQTSKIDVRLICATNADLHEEVRRGRFRQDLLRKYNKEIKGISSEAQKKLLTYRWPGNVRELRHAMERAVLMCNENAIISRDFSFEDEEHKRHTEVLNLDQLESQAIQRAIELSNGNLSEAADMLGITRYALYRKMK